MVGGLVQDQHIGKVDQHFRHGQALLLAAAQRVHRLLHVAQPETVQQRSHACLVVPGLELLHAIDRALQRLAALALRHRMLVLAHSERDRVVAIEHLVHQRMIGGHLHALIEVAGADPLVEDDPPLIGRFAAGDAFQQSALPAAVARHDRRFLALLQPEADVLEKLARTETFGDSLNGKYVHAGLKTAIGAGLRRYEGCWRLGAGC